MCFRFQAAVSLLVIFAAAMIPKTALPQSLNGDSWGDQVFEGVLIPVREVEVATSEFAILRELHVKAGDFVKANDLIAKLDTRELESQLTIAIAEYESRGKLHQVESELILQRQKVELTRQLHEKSSANIQEVQRAENDLRVVEARLQSEQENIEVLRLQVERLQRALELYNIRAPLDGVVVELQHEVGEFVSSSSPSVVKIHDVSQLKATFPLAEDEIQGMKVGGSMNVRLSDGRVVEGIIDFIPPVADPQSGWFMVTVLIDNKDASIRCSRCARVK